jgi:hypothetical protein
MQIVDKTHSSKGRENTRIKNEVRSSLSRNRITVSLKYAPSIVDELNKVTLIENKPFRR